MAPGSLGYDPRRHVCHLRHHLLACDVFCVRESYAFEWILRGLSGLHYHKFSQGEDGKLSTDTRYEVPSSFRSTMWQPRVSVMGKRLFLIRTVS
jgi:hypothetical protein